jgi:hypothetical protein
MAIVLDGSNQTTGGVINVGTAQASTSGTSITFTGIPSTAKRITVMFNGVSGSGTSSRQVQLGSGSVTTSGYNCVYSAGATTVNTFTASTGHITSPGPAANANDYGQLVFTLVGSNTWVGMSIVNATPSSQFCNSTSSITLSGTLDRVVFTTVNGTDTFDAGSVNIFWE